MRDLVVTLNSDGDQELPTTGVSEVEDTTELVSDNQNVNINDGSSSDIAADNDSNMVTTEQAVPPIEEVQDLPTTMKPAESKPTNKELVIGTWNIQSGRSTRLETAFWALGIVGMDLCFLTETKLMGGIYTQFLWIIGF